MYTTKKLVRQAPHYTADSCLETPQGASFLCVQAPLPHDTESGVPWWLANFNMIMYTPEGYHFLQMREKVRSTMEEIVRKAVADEKADSILGKPAKPTKFDCYKPALKTFSEKCFSFSKVCENSH